MSEGIVNADISEIEVTPKMIEAGVMSLLDYDPDFSNEEDTAVEIFKAMLRLSPR